MSNIPIPPMTPKFRRTNHELGVFISVITMGIYAPVYILVALNNRWYNKRVHRRYYEDLYRYNKQMELLNEHGI